MPMATHACFLSTVCRQVQLYVDVLDLLPCASCDAEAEIRRLEKLALQCNSELKRVYRHYCALGEGGVEHCFTLTIKGVRGMRFDEKNV